MSSARTLTRWIAAVAIAATALGGAVGLAPASAQGAAPGQAVTSESAASATSDVASAAIGARESGALPRPAVALNGVEFDPGNIISDANFFDRYAMSQADIQLFLDTKIGACSNSNCLNVKLTSSFTRPADVICAPYIGAANETTAAIIYKVQVACGVSAKVILVTLQKEQSLVTHKGPTDSKLARAMGYGCPDSAGGACDAEYGGLYNQIYWAARQFVRYGNPPGTTNYFTWFPVGATTNVLFHPDAARCGAAPVTIQNRATAALYYYTPYQPNASALANLRGEGDSCGSYGNRNFWVYYNDWFGSPTQGAGSAYGVVTDAVGVAGGIQLTGWAVVPTKLSHQVHLAVNYGSTWIGFDANLPNPAANAAFPGAGPNHGFSLLIKLPPGALRFCTWASGLVGTSVIDCRTVTVPDTTPPVGKIETANGIPGSITLTGWVVQPGALTKKVHLAVNIGSRWISVEADQPNPAGEAAYPGAGPNHGFAVTFDAPIGTHQVCLWASGPTQASVVECRSITVPASAPPVGEITSVVGEVGGFSLAGWAIQPSKITSPVHLAVNVGSQWTSVEADQPNPAGEAAYPGAGPNHGFSAKISAPPGSREFCLWASGPSGAVVIGCRTVTVPTESSPVGQMTATPVAGGIQIAGWAIQPTNITSAVHLAVNIGARWISVEADQPDPAGEANYPGAGPNHGFSAFIPTANGTQSFCLWASGPTKASVLQCATVVVAATPAMAGSITSATGVPGGIQIAGWAVIPSSITTQVHMSANIGSRWMSVEANQPNPAGEAAYPGAGPNHGFTALIPASAGTQSFCLWATGATTTAVFECRTVTVPPG